MTQKDLTPEIIAELKAKHGRIFLASPEGIDKACALRIPGRKELSAATAGMGKNPMKFNEIIIQTCRVWGDDPLADPNDEDGFFQAVVSKIDQIVIVRDCELKEL